MPLQKSPDTLPGDFPALRQMSAVFGQDSLHIQGAGGNVSVKDGDIIWIKASGTMLADAMTSDVFVPVDLPQMKAAITAQMPTADTPSSFVIPGASELRPSIETSVHSVFSHRIVLHTHCIHTLAHAIRKNAVKLLTQKLTAFDWAYVPYTKPGANLARSILEVLKPTTNVVVLGNHGLIVAAESVEAIRDLQNQVHAALAVKPDIKDGFDQEPLAAICDGSNYALPDDPFVHQLALTPARVKQVTAGSLYPDHVIFCGIAITTLPPNETPAEVEARALGLGRPPPVCLLVPGHGMILRKDVSQGARVMIHCLADVMTRVPETAELTYLSEAQNFELLDWDAEKYRQALNAK
ncbi:class II aldolase/adducin family protein [uncultured Roseobacter sp.]|uniref:class II aldolase/adducin family protein n=1 Tax=uncultured Roseobacter sp. TaxID=114847 RepID=UPI00260C57A9|nr:class II aldolase/adducin family protein [uncultured Roseobacter sp.]